MIIVTGDTHGGVIKDGGSLNKLSSRYFPHGRNLTKNDVVVILGDFGCVWNGGKSDQHWLKWLQRKPWTTLFVDGNHENFKLLYQYPVIEKYGGKVSEINDSVFWLRRGELYNIDGYRIWTFGGATSIDKMYRTKDVSWWPQEIPTHEEMQYGINKIENQDVNFIFTHTAPERILRTYFPLGMTDKLNDPVSAYLGEVENRVGSFDHWFFGHMHEDRRLDGEFTAVYKFIMQI